MIAASIRFSCWLPSPGYLELEFPMAGNDFPRCYSCRIPKARCCFDSGGSGNKYFWSTFQPGESPFTSFHPEEPDSATLLRLTRNTGAKGWQKKESFRVPVLIGSSCLEHATEKDSEGHSNLWEGICHNGLVMSAVDSDGKRQHVDWFCAVTSQSCPTNYLLKNP